MQQPQGLIEILSSGVCTRAQYGVAAPCAAPWSQGWTHAAGLGGEKHPGLERATRLGKGGMLWTC